MLDLNLSDNPFTANARLLQSICSAESGLEKEIEPSDNPVTLD